jgi:hypothetical protein
MSMLHKQGLKAGAWGCNSLKFVISVGGDLSISPISVRASPTTASGMQQLHLATRPAFRRVVAPRHSRRDRLTPLERRRMSFTSPVVGVAPILLLQQREAAGEALASNVEDGTQECEVRITRVTCDRLNKLSRYSLYMDSHM